MRNKNQNPTHMKTLLTSCLLSTFLLGNLLSQDLKVSLDQTRSKWFDSKIIGDRFLIQCYIPDQKTTPTDSLPIVFILDSDMSFGLAYDVVRWLNWGQEIPPVAIIGISYGTGQSDWWKKDHEIIFLQKIKQKYGVTGLLQVVAIISKNSSI